MNVQELLKVGAKAFQSGIGDSVTSSLSLDTIMDALAGLMPALKENAKSVPGSRVIPGRYTSVQQAIGTLHGRPALNTEVQDFLEEKKANGFVASLINKHNVTGKLQVAN